MASFRHTELNEYPESSTAIFRQAGFCPGGGVNIELSGGAKRFPTKTDTRGCTICSSGLLVGVNIYVHARLPLMILVLPESIGYKSGFTLIRMNAAEKWSPELISGHIPNTMWFMGPDIEIVSEITDIEVIADGGAIREIGRLRRMYGPGCRRKLKGRAKVRLPDATLCGAEVHWYEAHAIGKKEMKIKRILSE
jgi:hypothetical protein